MKNLAAEGDEGLAGGFDEDATGTERRTAAQSRWSTTPASERSWWVAVDYQGLGMPCIRITLKQTSNKKFM